MPTPVELIPKCTCCCCCLVCPGSAVSCLPENVRVSVTSVVQAPAPASACCDYSVYDGYEVHFRSNYCGWNRNDSTTDTVEYLGVAGLGLTATYTFGLGGCAAPLRYVGADGVLYGTAGPALCSHDLDIGLQCATDYTCGGGGPYPALWLSVRIGGSCTCDPDWEDPASTRGVSCPPTTGDPPDGTLTVDDLVCDGSGFVSATWTYTRSGGLTATGVIYAP